MRRTRLFIAFLGVALFLTALGFGTTKAHFNLNLNVRVFQVEHTPEGLRLYMRVPMPYLVAGERGPIGADGLPEAPPFTFNRYEEQGLMHLVDQDALKADPLGLGKIAANALKIETGGKQLKARVLAVRVYPIGEQPGFATLDEAKAAFNTEPVFPGNVLETYVGDALVDVLLSYDAGGPVSACTLSSTLDPEIPGQDQTANVILDYGSDGVKVFRAQGLMTEPVAVSPSHGSAAWSFIIEGINHILGGLDHVLFVLCIVIGATGLYSLVSRVTGFTLGHSVTLTLGFFGYVPKGAWFIPTVETFIALSIIYAAAVAIATEEGHPAREKTMFFVTFFIGLIHGLGFSFVLHEVLQIDAPNLWQSLLSFNIGIEIGQLAIVLLVWPALLILRRLSQSAWHYTRLGIAAACILVAGYWTVQRLPAIFETI
ncbi:MAG: HupE/UreJ family protein [Pseudomonadota bacterium]